jgi:outer membrane protein OmpA-like peptidoglycan-associated protein
MRLYSPLLPLGAAVYVPAAFVSKAGISSAAIRAAVLSTAVISAAVISAALPSTAHAQQLDSSVRASAPAPNSVAAAYDDDGETFAPRGNLWELGIFGGLLFISDRNAFHEAIKPFPNFENPSPEVGLRLSYLPLPFLGLEGEFMGAAAELDNGDGATAWAGRGHLLLQVPTRYVSPFLVVGGGRMGIFSDLAGDDSDPELHFGGGLKINLHRRVALRVDVRDNITKQRPESGTAHNVEALLGLSLVFGRPAPRPKDTDGDTVVDLQDQCPLEPGLLPDGCPIRDRDADGITDPNDQCPLEAGVAPTGCPVRDADGDGVLDARDECRETPGIAPTGCPDADRDTVLDRDDKCADVAGVPPDGCPADSDGDGLVDNQDRCPTQPETKNGFEDDDGCPDTLPDAVKRFNGVMKGIEFENGKAAIRPSSSSMLVQAAGILNQYPTLRVMVVGHTDNTGSHELNVDLSRRRAEAVKTFLMDRGIDADRIMTRGEGPDSPIASNSTPAGRQANRRIEFQIIK